MNPVAAELDTATPAPHPDVAADEYDSLLRRLARQSVAKHFDAYADIPWDEPEYAVDPEDPRFELTEAAPLGATRWYRTQPPAVRARLGLHVGVNLAKRGLQFEAVLKHGLLTFAATLPNGSPEFRYAYHEAIEEAQHALMFQEFVNRCGLPARGFNEPGLHLTAKRIMRLARGFPESFFIWVLGGEEPIDYLQRHELETNAHLHPLMRLICRLHVMEEARHLSFAHAYLRRHVPRLGRTRMLHLRVRTPLSLAIMINAMARLPPSIVREYAIPRSVLDHLYWESPISRRYRANSVRRIRDLCVDLGIATPPWDRLWRRFGIWADNPSPGAA